jgi:hypothetical protein
MEQKFSNSSRVMEPETISKNGASSKSHTSRMIFNKVTITAIALCMALSASAQWERAKEVNPYAELTWTGGGIRQDGKLLNTNQVREVMYGNREATQQFNSAMTLRAVGGVVMVPGVLATGAGLGWLLVAHLSGNVNEENKAGIHTACGILIGVGAVGGTTGFLLMSSGDKKLKNSLYLHNSNLKKDVSYQLNFGLTSIGGVGLTLRF